MVKSLIVLALFLTYFGMVVSSSNGNGNKAANIKESKRSSNTECQCPLMSNGFRQPFVLCGKEMINKQNCIPEAQYKCRNGTTPLISHICSEFITVTFCTPYTKQDIDNERDPELKAASRVQRKCVEPMN